MESSTLRHSFTLTNRDGFHMRPCGAFAQEASRFQSKVIVSRPGREVSGSSILDLMTLGAPQGTELTVQVEGPDAKEAMQALLGVLDRIARGEFEEKHEA
jgi:phosphotransferase system HPr (HPr) family protein